jgi:hypothetical protein
MSRPARGAMINNAHFRTFNENLARFITGVKARALARTLPRIGLAAINDDHLSFFGLKRHGGNV